MRGKQGPKARGAARCGWHGPCSGDWPRAPGGVSLVGRNLFRRCHGGCSVGESDKAGPVRERKPCRALQSLLLKRAVKFPRNLKRGSRTGVAIVDSVLHQPAFGRSRNVPRLTPGIVADSPDVRMRSPGLDLIGGRGSEKRSNDVARVLSVCILSHMRVLGADCTTQSDINHTDSG
jgi:hypothetical protein